MNRICTICARGGSKGVPGKNITPLAGKPLIAHSIDQALLSNKFTLIAVSSDSDEILRVAEEYGADLMIKRPKELASDDAAKLPAIRHAVLDAESRTGLRFQTIVDLDATSPLRVPDDIRAAVDLLESRRVGQVITGSPARRSPYFNLVELTRDGYVRLSKPIDPPVVRRQDAPETYDMNASIYVWSRSGLFEPHSPFHSETLLYVMPEDRSVDIDSELDLEFVRFIVERRGASRH